MNKIQISYELAGVAISTLPAEKLATAKADINAFLAEEVKLDMSGMTAQIAENSASEIHLCLPYYSYLDGKVENVADDEMQAAGGSDRLYRLPASSDYYIITIRNLEQAAWNAHMAFAFRYDLIDNSYDGDFDAERNDRAGRYGEFDK